MNFEKPLQPETELSDKELLTPRNGGKRKTKPADIIPQSSIGTDERLAAALNNLSVPDTIPQEEKPKSEVAINIEKKKDPIEILKGISREKSITGILGLVRDAFDNETDDEAKSYYTVILDTLEKIDKTINNNPQSKIDSKLIDLLSENFDLRNTVRKIIGVENIREEVVEKRESKRKNENATKTLEETPEQTLNKIKDAQTIAEVIDLIEKAGGVADSDDVYTPSGDLIETIKTMENMARNGNTIPKLFSDTLMDNFGLRDRVLNILAEYPKTPEIEPEKSKPEKEDETEKEKEVKSRPVLDSETISDLKKAFDTEGFLDFLSKNPDINFDIEDTNNAEKVLKLHEAFLIKDEVSKGMTNVISEELNNLVGISDNESIASLDSYLNSQVYEDPEKVLEYKNQLDTLKDGRLQIGDLQEKLSVVKSELPLGRVTTEEEAELEMLNVVRDASIIGPVGRKIMSQVAKNERFFDGENYINRLKDSVLLSAKTFFVDIPYALYQLANIRSKENRDLRKSAQAKIEKITGEKYSRKAVERYMEKIAIQKTRSAEIAEYERKLSSYNQIYDIFKKDVAAEMLKIDEVTEEAGEKIKRAIRKLTMADNFDLSASDKAQGLLERVQKVIMEDDGPDFLKAEDLADLQEEINRKSQEAVLKQIQETLDSNKRKKGKFSDIEKALKGILEKTKIGSKEGTEVRKVIKDALVTVAKKYNDPVTTIRIKAFILTNKL